MISNHSKSFITTPNVFNMYFNRIPGILINLNQFGSSSYFKQVSVDVGIWYSENMGGLGFGNLRI